LWELTGGYYSWEGVDGREGHMTELVHPKECDANVPKPDGPWEHEELLAAQSHLQTHGGQGQDDASSKEGQGVVGSPQQS